MACFDDLQLVSLASMTCNTFTSQYTKNILTLSQVGILKPTSWDVLNLAGEDETDPYFSCAFCLIFVPDPRLSSSK